MHDNFPQFLGWPPRKVYFLENMACEQVPKEVDEGPSYVIVTNEMSDDINFNYTCDICKQRLVMTFNHEEEEWVFNDSKGVNGVVYHYPLCYEIVVGKRG